MNERVGVRWIDGEEDYDCCLLTVLNNPNHEFLKRISIKKCVVGKNHLIISLSSDGKSIDTLDILLIRDFFSENESDENVLEILLFLRELSSNNVTSLTGYIVLQLNSPPISISLQEMETGLYEEEMLSITTSSGFSFFWFFDLALKRWTERIKFNLSYFEITSFFHHQILNTIYWVEVVKNESGLIINNTLKMRSFVFNRKKEIKVGQIITIAEFNLSSMVWFGKVGCWVLETIAKKIHFYGFSSGKLIHTDISQYKINDENSLNCCSNENFQLTLSSLYLLTSDDLMVFEVNSQKSPLKIERKEFQLPYTLHNLISFETIHIAVLSSSPPAKTIGLKPSQTSEEDRTEILSILTNSYCYLLLLDMSNTGLLSDFPTLGISESSLIIRGAETFLKNKILSSWKKFSLPAIPANLRKNGRLKARRRSTVKFCDMISFSEERQSGRGQNVVITSMVSDSGDFFHLEVELPRQQPQISRYPTQLIKTEQEDIKQAIKFLKSTLSGQPFSPNQLEPTVPIKETSSSKTARENGLNVTLDQLFPPPLHLQRSFSDDSGKFDQDRQKEPQLSSTVQAGRSLNLQELGSRSQRNSNGGEQSREWFQTHSQPGLKTAPRRMARNTYLRFKKYVRGSSSTDGFLNLGNHESVELRALEHQILLGLNTDLTESATECVVKILQSSDITGLDLILSLEDDSTEQLLEDDEDYNVIDDALLQVMRNFGIQSSANEQNYDEDKLGDLDNIDLLNVLENVFMLSENDGNLDELFDDDGNDDDDFLVENRVEVSVFNGSEDNQIIKEKSFFLPLAEQDWKIVNGLINGLNANKIHPLPLQMELIPSNYLNDVDLITLEPSVYIDGKSLDDEAHESDDAWDHLTRLDLGQLLDPFQLRDLMQQLRDLEDSLVEQNQQKNEDNSNSFSLMLGSLFQSDPEKLYAFVRFLDSVYRNPISGGNTNNNDNDYDEGSLKSKRKKKKGSLEFQTLKKRTTQSSASSTSDEGKSTTSTSTRKSFVMDDLFVQYRHTPLCYSSNSGILEARKGLNSLEFSTTGDTNKAKINNSLVDHDSNVMVENIKVERTGKNEGTKQAGSFLKDRCSLFASGMSRNLLRLTETNKRNQRNKQDCLVKLFLWSGHPIEAVDFLIKCNRADSVLLLSIRIAASANLLFPAFNISSLNNYCVDSNYSLPNNDLYFREGRGKISKKPNFEKLYNMSIMNTKSSHINSWNVSNQGELDFDFWNAPDSGILFPKSTENLTEKTEFLDIVYDKNKDYIVELSKGFPKYLTRIVDAFVVFKLALHYFVSKRLFNHLDELIKCKPRAITEEIFNKLIDELKQL